jgi:hypothetical protein
MKAIHAMKCVYATKTRSWAVQLLHGDEATRFEVADGQEARLLIDAYANASGAVYDEASGELHFIYEEADEEEDEDGDDEYLGPEGDDEEDEEEEIKPKRR